MYQTCNEHGFDVFANVTILTKKSLKAEVGFGPTVLPICPAPWMYIRRSRNIPSAWLL